MDRSTLAARIAQLFLLYILGGFLPCSAQEPLRTGGIGGLLIAPTRVVFEARDRVAEVTLINRSTKRMTYRISLVNKRMTDEGNLEDITLEEAADFSADRLVILAPRQAVLAPGESQKVRLKVRRPAGLQAGEYRSHIFIQPAPEDAGVWGIYGGSGSGESDLTIGVKTTPALSLPVIVRHGVTAVTLEMSDLTLTEADAESTGNAATVRFRLHREGNQGAYGDVTIAHVDDVDGAARTLAILRGIAVYTPNSSRLVEVPLAGLEGLPRTGQLRVVYHLPDEDGGTPLAQGEIALH